MAILGEVDFLVFVNRNVVLRVRALIMKNLQMQIMILLQGSRREKFTFTTYSY